MTDFTALNICLCIWAVNSVFTLILLAKKKKIRLVSAILTCLVITFFNLLTPHGKILFETRFFILTDGAFIEGLTKSGVLIFTVLLSKILTGIKFPLPEKLASFLDTVFTVYNKLTRSRIKFKPRQLIVQLDRLFLDIWNSL